MSEYWDFLKARKDYLTRKPRKQYIRHAGSNYYGTINQYANKYLTERLSGEKVSKERRDELFNRVKNHMLNMPHEYGLDLISYKDVPKGSLPKRKRKTYVRHADSGFEGSIGSAANRLLNQQIAASGMDVDKDTREQLRAELKNRMEANPQEYGLSVIEGAKASDFKRKKKDAGAQAVSAPLTTKPILPKQTSTSDGMDVQKVMQAMNLLQQNNFPVTAESIQALLPHLPEQTPQIKPPYQTSYPQLTDDGRFNTTPRSSFRGTDIQTPAQKEEMLQYIRQNPDRRVQDDDFFERERIKEMEEKGHSPQSILDLLYSGGLETAGKADKPTWKDKANRNEGMDIRGNLLDTEREADPMGAFSQLFPSRYKEEGGLAGAGNRSAVGDEERPEIPIALDPKRDKKRIENIKANQQRFDVRSLMTEEQLNQARQKKLEADMAARAQATAQRNAALANAPENITNPQTTDDWMAALDFHRQNPVAQDIPSLGASRTKDVVDDMIDPLTGQLKEEYR